MSEDCPRIDVGRLPVFPALEQLWHVLPEARLVGGAVRDLLLGTPVSDFDLGTPEPPEEVCERLKSAGIRVVPTGLSHGTVTAVINGSGYEITTLRRDEETDGRHARVVWTQDWAEDAARRDFTINALSCDSSGQVHDYFTGLTDLRAARVRFVGDAAERIREDALRILRFFRFQGRFGGGRPDAGTLAALSEGAALIVNLSVERVWSELKRILTGPSLTEILRLMQETGALRQCLPELRNEDAGIGFLFRMTEAGAPAEACLRLAALLKGAGCEEADVKQCGRRLKLSRQEMQVLCGVSGSPVPLPEIVEDADAVRRFLAYTPAEILRGRTWLAEAGGSVSPAGDWTVLRQVLSATRVPVFPLAGKDLIAAGFTPGPAMGQMMKRARDWWWQGGCTAEREECLEFAQTVSG